MKSIRRGLAGLFLPLFASLAGAQRTLFTVDGSAAQGFGGSIDIVGDLDGDGHGEFLIGTYLAKNGSLDDAGLARIFSGADGSVLATFRGVGRGDFLGFGSGAAGDVNRDGFADVCIASYGDNVPGIGVDAGSVEILSGVDRSRLFLLTGTAANVFLGSRTVPGGDVNGDGKLDVLVRGGGRVMIFSGSDGSLLRELSGHPGFGLSRSFAGVGDVNGDGFADVAALQLRVGTAIGEDLLVFSGADGSELWFRPAGLDDASVAGVMDANGDGHEDIVLGMPGRGLVLLLSGLDGTVIHEVAGLPGERMGEQVTGAGDVDGDGYGDFVASLPGLDGAARADMGAVRAYSGRTGAVIATVEGALAGEGFGTKLAGGRDVNGDGIADVIAGTTSFDGPVRVEVLSFVPRGLEPFGTGTPGCAGTSTLLANGAPTLGNAGFELHVSNAGAAPLLLVGDTEDTAGSLHFGVRFHLDFNPPAPGVGLLFQRRLPDPDANGSVVAPFPIPSNPALLGRKFVLQVASLFSPGTCPQRLTTSRGLRLTIQ